MGRSQVRPGDVGPGRRKQPRPVDPDGDVSAFSPQVERTTPDEMLHAMREPSA